MDNHRFDPAAAILGILTVAVGTAVVLRTFDSTNADVNVGVLIAVAAIAVGLALMPWGRRTSKPNHDRDVEPAGPVE